MRLNTLSPAPGSKPAKRRVGRGIGSGLGKTCGRGHKGQKARSGGYHKVGFEGGQMPLARRLPKFGFTSRRSLLAQEVKLGDLMKVAGDLVSLETLKAFDLVKSATQFVKIVASGEIGRAFTVQGIKVTAGAKAAILAQGGKIEG